MLKNITWLQYFTAVFLILVPYYAFLLLRYYKRTKAGTKDDSQRSYEDAHQEEQEYTEEPDFDSIPEDLFTQAQELIAKLKAFLIRASNEGLEREELLVNVKSHLDDYPSLNIDAFRPAINEMIVAECDRNSSVTLSEREVDGLWE
ncbi:hypothetical protein [Chitinophaga niabensis]|uniref:Uncharacterized protein n=1 Tax=Chitinophaga niabensis TaxID=536979 RepID=A0A1N6E4B2_9BACT|nr:hypothetical protein [Chitinophaga niabensis]SIN77846.1 hypothetical protein SAMN04488055_1292 [Chitinophaga niabensis]